MNQKQHYIDALLNNGQLGLLKMLLNTVLAVLAALSRRIQIVCDQSSLYRSYSNFAVAVNQSTQTKKLPATTLMHKGKLEQSRWSAKFKDLLWTGLACSLRKCKNATKLARPNYRLNPSSVYEEMAFISSTPLKINST